MHDILQSTRSGQQIEALKNESDFTIAEPGQLLFAHALYVAPLQPITTSRWPVETAQYVHQSRFAGARDACQCDVIVLADLQIDFVQSKYRFITHHVAFLYIDQFDQGRF